MRKVNRYSIEIQSNKKILAVIFMCVILFALTLLSACSQSQSNYLSQAPTLAETMENITVGVTLTPTQTLPPTATELVATQLFIAPTRTIDPLYNIDDPILFTQGPIIVSTIYPEDLEYLYRDTVVTVRLEEDFIDNAYLNLDDLNNNGMGNSDIQIKRYIGNEISYSLHPTNNALYYYSDERVMDFNSCKEHFPNLGLTFLDYLSQGYFFIDGGSYCVFTNEGRIAIVSYIKDSKIFVGEWPQEVLSVKVTVYQKKIE